MRSSTDILDGDFFFSSCSLLLMISEISGVLLFFTGLGAAVEGADWLLSGVVLGTSFLDISASWLLERIPVLSVIGSDGAAGAAVCGAFALATAFLILNVPVR